MEKDLQEAQASGTKLRVPKTFFEVKASNLIGFTRWKRPTHHLSDIVSSKSWPSSKSF